MASKPRRPLRTASVALIVTCALLLAAGCSSASMPNFAAAKAPTATAVPRVQPTAALPTARPADATLTSAVEPILTRTAALRSLPVQSKVPLGTVDRSRLGSYLQAVFEREHAREELEKTKAIYMMLDLVKERDSLYDLQLGLLSEQVIGFYEFESKAMRLVTGAGQFSPADEVTLSHEYVHALQDQNFGIGERMKQVQNDLERGGALQALVEGDATLEMALYAKQNLSPQQLSSIGQQSGTTSQDKLRSAPLVEQIGLMFPYQQGANFVQTLYQAGGWAAVDRAFANPPTTTEQILNPQKYLSGEAAQPVELPKIAPALGPGWSLIKEDTLGELGVLIYLTSGIAPDKAAKAADGWSGDRVAVYRNSGGYDYAFVGVFSWDTPQDASEFFGAVKELRQPKGGLTLLDSSHISWTALSRSGYLSIKGNKTVLAITTAEAVMNKLLAALDEG